MRNPGGSVCLARDILSRLTTREFFGAWAEVRVTWTDILELNYALTDPYGDYTAEDLEQLRSMQAEYQEQRHGSRQPDRADLRLSHDGRGRQP